MKQKIILFALLIGLGLGVKGQTWLTVGNTLQRTTDGTGFKYRFSLGSPGFYNLSDSIRNGGKTYTAGYGMSLVGQQFRVDTSAIVSKTYLVNRLAAGQNIGANTTGNAATTSAVSGTINYIPKFTSSNAIGNSLIFDDGTNLGIGTTSLTEKLNINGMLRVSGDFGSSGGTGIKLNNINQFGYSELVIDNDTPLSGGGFVFGYGGTASGVPNFAYFTQRRNAPIIFQTNNLTRLMIDGGGNVSVNSLVGTGDRPIFAGSDGTLKIGTIPSQVQNNLTASTTLAPSVTAVNTGLALKANKTGGNNYTGSQTITVSSDTTGYSVTDLTNYTQMLRSRFQVTNNAYQTAYKVDGIEFQDMASGSKIYFNYPATVTGSNKTVTLRDKTITVAGLEDISRRPIVNKTANYTATANDYTITGNATSASFTITLPTAASSYDATSTTGQIYNFKKTDSSVNTITIQANGSELIDGTNTKTITTQYGGFTVQSTGTSWIIIN